MKSLFFCSIILFLLVLVGQNTLAAGLSVNMGIELLQQIPLGEEYLIRPTLVIHNKSNRASTFVLSAVKPSTGLGTTKGYFDLPQTDWISFEKEQIKIPPNSKDSLRVYLNIPKGDKYYNQHWSVYISVAAKPGGGNISLACYPKILIETESREGPNQKNDNPLGLEPNILKFENIGPNQRSEKRKFKIYNNGKKKETYNISVLGKASCRENRIALTPGYRFIPDSSWIKLYPARFSSGKSVPFKIRIGGGKKYSLPLRIELPEEAQKKKWEGIIFVESEDGLSNFVRIQIEPNK